MVNTIGRNITAQLERHGRTQSWLAETVGVSNAAVTKWIAIGQISRDNLEKVARALNVRVDQLLHGTTPAVGERIAGAINALPVAAQQEIVEFIQFKLERAGAQLAEEEKAAYTAAIAAINDDMQQLKDPNPDKE